MSYRIGFGYDVHRLDKGEDFWLGGIKINHYKGAVAHSDGDVLIHSICDALLGAANLGDIGKHFPDSSDAFKNIDSKILLKKTYSLIQENNYQLVNLDATICLQKPKINPYIPQMKETLANTINVEQEKISIKATTTEKLGFTGSEEGISAYVVVLIEGE